MSNDNKAKQTVKKETKVAEEKTSAVPTTYVVKKGDKISDVATKLGISVGMLLEKNNLEKPVIKMGQELNI